MQIILTEAEYNELKAKADGGASINLHTVKDAIIEAFFAKCAIEMQGIGLMDSDTRRVIARMQIAKGNTLNEYRKGATLDEFLK